MSYVEAVRIIQSEPPFTLQKVPSFVCFNQNRMFSDYIIRNPRVIRTASESFGRWFALHRTRLSIVLVLGQVKNTWFLTALSVDTLHATIPSL